MVDINIDFSRRLVAPRCLYKSSRKMRETFHLTEIWSTVFGMNQRGAMASG